MRHVRFLLLSGGWHRAWAVLCGAALLGGPLWPVTAAAQVTAPPLAPASAPLVFRGVTVIDVREGRRVPNQTVVIVERRIQTVAPVNQVRVPRGARVVEARGKYLIPGLWDMHVHLMMHPGYMDIAFPQALAYGVTGLRDAGSSIPLATLQQQKQEIAAGTRVGPRLVVSGPSISAPSSQSTTIASYDHFISAPAALAGRLVDSLKAAGADMLKLYGVSGEVQMALIAAAKRAGLLFGGHAPESGGLTMSDSGAAFLDHGPYLERTCDTSCLAAAAQRLRRNNTWITVIGWGSLWASPSFTSKTARRPTSTAELLKASGYTRPSAKSDLVQAGMPIVIGNDFNVGGYALHKAVTTLAVEWGMTPLEVLQTVTLNPARALRATDSLGTVETGKVADLVLLDRDPLSDSWHMMAIRAVVANGRYYDRAALDRLVVDAERAAR